MKITASELLSLPVTAMVSCNFDQICDLDSNIAWSEVREMKRTGDLSVYGRIFAKSCCWHGTAEVVP